MSGFRENLASLKKFSAALRDLPRVVSSRVAERSAPAITADARSTFAASSDPYGAPWKPGTDGKPVTLRKTGALARFVFYVAIGAKLRVALGVPYAKYQIGRRLVFPRQGGALPPAYVETLTKSTASVIREEFGA